MQSFRSNLRPLVSLVTAALGVSVVHAAPTVFSSAGTTTAAIQGTVDSYRAALGTLNPNNGSAATSGRREINWDAVPDSASAPNLFPGTFFGQAFNGANGGRTRGALFSAQTGSLLVGSNNPGPSSANALFLQDLANSNVSFPAFSGDQVFLAQDSVFTDTSFVVPGTASSPAFVSSFGVVFLDVEAANTTGLEFFDLGNNSLGSFSAPVSGAGGFSFLGVDFGVGTTVGRVRITAGSEAFSAFAAGSALRESTGDLVGMDDFFYSEPISTAAIPEPSSFAALAGLAALSGTVLRRRRKA